MISMITLANEVNLESVAETVKLNTGVFSKSIEFVTLMIPVRESITRYDGEFPAMIL